MAENTSVADKPKKRLPKWVFTLLVCLAILGVAGAAVKIIQSTEPTPQRTGASRRTAMLVETTPAERGAFRPVIEVLGTVRAREEISLSPRVSGEIIERSPDFTSGGFLEKGQMILRIDPADYENIVAQRRSALHQAEADLDIEMGRQQVAQLDYELLGDDIDLDDKSLILRQPQLNAAKADVEAARAALAQAELDLERTTIRAPFDAQVISRNANVGSQVARGDDLGQLVAVDSYWVVATVPLSKLRMVEFAREEEPGSKARIRIRSAWPAGLYREGEVLRLIGALDPMTRLARVNIAVADPLTRSGDPAKQPPLIIDAVAEVTIEGRELNDVIRIDRDYLRENDTVWAKEEGELRIKRVTVAFRDARYAYVSEGLSEGEQIVTSGLSTVVEGAPLRVEGEPAVPEEEAS